MRAAPLLHCCWNHETFYHGLKSHLDLENFSGQTVEAVLTAQGTANLAEHGVADEPPEHINRAVTFHALKDQVLARLYSDTPAEQVLTKLQRLFLSCPIRVRPDRKPPPRTGPSLSRSCHFQRRVRKIVF